MPALSRPRAQSTEHPVPERSEARAATSIDKALDLCEALSASPRGLSLADLARQVRLPRPTAHRLLALLRRRGYVRQEEETGRYVLTLRLLDLSFQALGRSEIRLHAYPVLREYVLRTGFRTFVAVPAEGEVTYVWSAGPDEVSMYTAYGKAMPGHCSIYFGDAASLRRLVCVRLDGSDDAARSARVALRLGFEGEEANGAQRLNCTCAPVHDYNGREVARVGVFAHDVDERALHQDYARAAWDLARRVSLRLGHLGS